MLRFLTNVFSRKNRTQKRTSSTKESQSPKETQSTKETQSPKESHASTKSSPKDKGTRSQKSILKKSPAATRKKSLTFSHDIAKEYVLDLTTPRRIDIMLVPKCNPPQRPKTYPCRNKYTIFDNAEEFNQYARDFHDKIINQRQRGLPSVSSHYKTMKTRLKETGSYRKKIPPEYRFYDDESGKIVDIRLFPDYEEDD